MTDFFSNIALGLSVAVSVQNLLFCFIGVFIGTLVGVIPGIGPMTAIALLMPVTFKMEPTTALIMLAGIWYGTGYGGRTASIMLNLPGSPSNAVTCLDGYPLTKAGRGGMALFMTTMASFGGGTIGVIILMVLSPLVAQVAMSFGAPEYFALMLFGLIASSVIAGEAPLKGVAMVIIGIAIGLIGTDINTGDLRFTFGTMSLMDGIAIATLAMGLFGISEIIASVNGDDAPKAGGNTKEFTSNILPTKSEARRSILPVLRGSGIGAFFGALPGTGPSVAAFISYAVEKGISKTPQNFGKGAIEGIMAPEASDNAAEQTAFIPTLALGIPGSATMALMLGALMIHGIAPGPTLATDEPALFWGLIMSFWIGNVMLVLLNVPLIGLWVRLLSMPYLWLFPSVLVFIGIGVYTVHMSTFDIWLVVAFGLAGIWFRALNFPIAPLLLGFVLGPIMEEHFRRAMMMSRGKVDIFFTHPVSAALIAITVGLILVTAYRSWRSHAAQTVKNATS